MDSISQNRMETLFAAWSKPLENWCKALEAKCQELTQRLDAFELSIDEKGLLESRLIMLEARVLAQTDAIKASIMKKIEENVDLQNDSECLRTARHHSALDCLQNLSPGGLAEQELHTMQGRQALHGPSASASQSQLARLNAPEMPNTLKTFFDRGQGTLSNQAHSTDGDGFDSTAGNAASVEHVDESLTREVNGLSKRLVSVDPLTRGRVRRASVGNTVHAPLSGCMQRDLSDDRQARGMLWHAVAESQQQQPPPPLRQRRQCSADNLTVIEPGPSSAAS